MYDEIPNIELSVPQHDIVSCNNVLFSKTFNDNPLSKIILACHFGIANQLWLRGDSKIVGLYVAYHTSMQYNAYRGATVIKIMSITNTTITLHIMNDLKKDIYDVMLVDDIPYYVFISDKLDYYFTSISNGATQTYAGHGYQATIPTKL